MNANNLPIKSVKSSSRKKSPRHALSIASLSVAALMSGLVAAPAMAERAVDVTPSKTLNLAQPVSFADVAEKVSPAVVNIQVTSRAKPMMTEMQGMPGNMREFFERYSGKPGAPDAQPQNRGKGQKTMGAGSGFVVDADGFIVTNEHVIHDADEITVTFQDGKTAKARLIGQDDKTDLALIKIDVEKPIPFVRFGQSDAVRVGDWILTVGNPFGLGHSVNVGIVSARGRTIGAGPYDDFLQIDAPINRGNSGGPAFDLHGNVVGVNAAIFSPNGGNVGIGFAIPSKIAENVIAELKSKGAVERGWLGVLIQPLNSDLADGLGLSDTNGVLVSDVNEQGPAKQAGLLAGDVILSVDGEVIEKLKELPRVIADIDPGASSSITIWRDGEEKSFVVKIGTLPVSDKVAAAVIDDKSVEAKVGLALKKMDADIARQLGLPSDSTGVVVMDVRPGSPAAEKGIRPGDVLAKVGGKNIDAPKDLSERMMKARLDGKKSILALIKRGDTQRFIAIPVGAA